MADQPKQSEPAQADQDNTVERPQAESQSPEVGGRKGPEPTRYGDWEKNGRCIDF